MTCSDDSAKCSVWPDAYQIEPSGLISVNTSKALLIMKPPGTARIVVTPLEPWLGLSRNDRVRGSVRTWLLGIVRNRAIDLLRREVLHAPQVTFDPELSKGAVAREETDSEALRREAARDVRGALEVLPRDQMHVIELAYFGGLTHSEIAEMLGMPLGTVKGRMRLALDKMRDGLGEAVA